MRSMRTRETKMTLLWQNSTDLTVFRQTADNDAPEEDEFAIFDLLERTGRLRN